MFFSFQVLAHLNSRYMMFIPKHIISNKNLILQLLNVTSGQEEINDPPGGKEDGYLLMLGCDNLNDQLYECPEWRGDVIRVELTAENAIALSHIEVMTWLENYSITAVFIFFFFLTMKIN